MPDELDALLGTEGSDAGGVTTQVDDADQITMSKAEVARLTAAADSVTGLSTTVEQLREQIELDRNRQQQRERDLARPADVKIDPAQFYADPQAAIDERVRKGVQEMVAPAAAQMQANMGQMALQTFKAQKTGDPMFAGVVPFFDKKSGRLNLQWVGSLSPQDQQSTLNEAWYAAKGEYVDVEGAKRASQQKRPTNLGGGDGTGGGGSTGTKSLAELDPTSYRWAVENHLSEDDMKEIAADIQKKKSDD